jgi:hypothetical protein
MDARIVHFGFDDCARIAVLKRAGYCVEDCNSVSLLHAALVEVRGADAVAITENDGVAPNDLISLARATSMAPLILFQSTNPHYDESEFDLVVPALTGPRQWLSEIGRLIEQKHSAAESQKEARQLV